MLFIMRDTSSKNWPKLKPSIELASPAASVLVSSWSTVPKMVPKNEHKLLKIWKFRHRWCNINELIAKITIVRYAFVFHFRIFTVFMEFWCEKACLRFFWAGDVSTFNYFRRKIKQNHFKLTLNKIAAQSRRTLSKIDAW